MAIYIQKGAIMKNEKCVWEKRKFIEVEKRELFVDIYFTECRINTGTVNLPEYNICKCGKEILIK